MSSTERSRASGRRRSESGEHVTPGWLMKKTSEDSVAVRRWRSVWRGSKPGLSPTRLGRALSARTSWIGTRLARHPATLDFQGAVRTVEDSALLSAADRIWVAVAQAQRRSAARRVVDRLIEPLERSQRVRFIGWIIVVAMSVHVMLSVHVLRQNWRSATVWLLLLAGGCVLVAASRPFASAWAHSRWRPPSE